jgi:hypothetical protein
MHSFPDAFGAQRNGVDVAGKSLGIDVFLIEMLALYTVREAIEKIQAGP